jgi:hypothetical protein
VVKRKTAIIDYFYPLQILVSSIAMGTAGRSIEIENCPGFGQKVNKHKCFLN